jgi:predicted RNA binding protein YcfA (HicA-like mRNA interferase family)
MKKKDDLQHCTKSDDFIHHAKKRGAKIRNGKGSHIVICTDKGSCPVPRHGNQELSKGMACHLRKVFTLLGLAILVFALWFTMIQ